MSISIIFCGLALIVVPDVAPSSRFAKWIAEYGIINYVAWCLIGIVALGVIFHLISFALKRNNAA